MHTNLSSWNQVGEGKSHTPQSRYTTHPIPDRRWGSAPPACPQRGWEPHRRPHEKRKGKNVNPNPNPSTPKQKHTTNHLEVMTKTRHFSLGCWLAVRWERMWPQHVLPWGKRMATEVAAARSCRQESVSNIIPLWKLPVASGGHVTLVFKNFQCSTSHLH